MTEVLLTSLSQDFDFVKLFFHFALKEKMKKIKEEITKEEEEEERSRKATLADGLRYLREID